MCLVKIQIWQSLKPEMWNWFCRKTNWRKEWCAFIIFIAYLFAFLVCFYQTYLSSWSELCVCLLRKSRVGLSLYPSILLQEILTADSCRMVTSHSMRNPNRVLQRKCETVKENPPGTCKCDISKLFLISSHWNRHLTEACCPSKTTCTNSSHSTVLPLQEPCLPSHISFNSIRLSQKSPKEGCLSCHQLLLVGQMKMPGPSARCALMGSTEPNSTPWKPSDLGWLRDAWSLMYRQGGVPKSYTRFLSNNRAYASHRSNFTEMLMIPKKHPKTNTKTPETSPEKQESSKIEGIIL